WRPVSSTNDRATTADVGGAPARSLAQDPEFLAAVLGTAGSLIIVLDRGGRTVLFNHACEELTGYSAREVVGIPFWDVLLAEEEVDGVRAVFDRLCAGEFPSTHENYWITRAGPRRLIRWSNTALRDAAGEVRFVIGMGQDVTDVREAERRARSLLLEQGARQAAESAAERLEHILEGIADGFFSIDPQWRLTYINREAERALELTRDSALGRVIWDIVPAVRGTIFERECRAAMEERAAREFDAYYPPAQTWFGARLYPFRDGLTVFFQDITRRKRGEEARRFLAEAGSILSSSLDYQTTLQAVARLAVTGVAEICIVDVIERDGIIRRLEFAHRDPDKQALVAELKVFPLDRALPHLVFKALETGKSQLVRDVPDDYFRGISQGEHHYQLLKALDICSHVVVPMIAHSRTTGVITFVRCTDDRPYDEEDLGLVEELARRAAIAVENARLYGDAKQAVLARDDVLAAVSHELGNPLQAIIMAEKMMVASVQDDTARYYGDAIRRSAERMERLIHDLLEVHRVQARQLALEKRACAVEPLVREACEGLMPLAEAKPLAIELEFAEALPRILADAGRVVQVVSNVVGNAVKFTPSGGKIRVRVTAQGDEVIIEVSDTGPGIPPDQLPLVFDRFWQARRTGRVGIGLGLAIAKGIVDSHGGHIGVESLEGKGSRFYFTFPRAENA
ncbi:MAG TPA: ATP-binding protein, partial [Longimicrobiales bacterium]